MTFLKNSRILLFFLFATVVSCTEDYFDFDKISVENWKPELAAPLINSSLSLEDIIISKDSNGIVSQDDQGLLQVIYNGRVYTDLGVAGVNLPQATFNEKFSGVNLPPSGTVSFNYNSILNYSTANNLEIDSSLLKAGNLQFRVESDFQHNISLTINFPTIRSESGQIVSEVLDFGPSNGSQAVVRSFNQDLTNYTIDFTNNGSDINSLPYEVNITIEAINGNPSSLNDELRFNTRLNNLDYKHFYGYIGQAPFDLRKDTILIGILKNFKTGTFFISNPSLEIDISNSFGIPMSLDFDELLSINQNGNRTINYNNIPLTAIPLNSPARINTAENTTLDLDRTNSNIDSIVSSIVKEIAYDSKARINPQGNNGMRNFLSDTSRIGLGISLKMPFSGYVTNLILIDTLEINLETFKEFEKGIIRTIASNGFPMSAEIQFIFTDNNYNVLDSLYPSGAQTIIPAAFVDLNGRAVQNGDALIDTEVNREKFVLMSEAKYILVRAKIETTKQVSNPTAEVKFYPEYRLNIKMGAKATVNIN